jgi:hypothetical protein
MCLTRIYESKPPTEGTFWKVFRYRFGYLASECVDQDLIRERGIWIKAKNVDVFKAPIPYMSGFHGFTTYQDAQQWIAGYCVPELSILECQYRKGRIWGEQEWFDYVLRAKVRRVLTVVVADEMLIPLEDMKCNA